MTVQLAILGFLRERNYHGYELKKTITRLMGMWTDIKFGSIYHALNSLERAGFVQKVEITAAAGRPTRSTYSITESGQKEFARLVEENILDLQRIYLRDDIGVYFGGGIEKRKFKHILERRIALLESIAKDLVEHRQYMESQIHKRGRVALYLITRHIKHLELEIDWFKELKAAFKEGILYLKKGSQD